jgi:hypothetical protein
LLTLGASDREEAQVTERELTRNAARRLAIIRHAQEISGNVALTCRYYGITRQCYSGDERGADAVAGHGVQTLTDEALHGATLVEAAGTVDEAALEVERRDQHGDSLKDGVEQGAIVRAGGLRGNLDGDVC